MPLEKYLADGLQSGCTANFTGTQHKLYIITVLIAAGRHASLRM